VVGGVSAHYLGMSAVERPRNWRGSGTENKDVDGARCLERGRSDVGVKSSFVNLTTCFFYRSFTTIIYYIEMKYSIVQSVKKECMTHSTGYCQ
jgi:hypothetical protein